MICNERYSHTHTHRIGALVMFENIFEMSWALCVRMYVLENRQRNTLQSDSSNEIKCGKGIHHCVAFFSLQF